MLDGDVEDVAPRLLGLRLATEFEGERTEVVITEVEAYGGADDPASHAFRGRTKRNGAMFEAAGTLYVYRSYGVHWCANVVTGQSGFASAVLLRGGAPAAGVERMRERRGVADRVADGPGKLCAALGITGDHDGSSLVEGPVRLMQVHGDGGAAYETRPRIGITKAVDRPWRFVATANRERSEGWRSQG